MSDATKPGYAPGDRIRATERSGFPAGTVLKAMADGFVLVRWDNGLLETAHGSEIERIE